ncbi:MULTISPECIES: BglG family transcription antiterminator [Thermoanaerobacterium]|uniref:PTS modulated transcriptional regulator MtlR family n=2 Tax=Thermoanaerobacterium TaxID=28895 RepID=W9ECD8_9THEO|nr:MULTISPECIES: BglG family transcription antiterminator [Thermoanaerobacterium]AFK85985.1 PTS modulated transcriptional regulator, MtlR family [Thermoanaerobacterium saccharolyticum JW/SL-YS485]ETO38675.1 PTS modulated transcriptional regulator MtlR family [Thermoanaerobacterium aotearoense SCUT27]
MSISERDIEIIKILLNTDEPLVVDEIAERLRVSNKTIRNDLKKIEEYLIKRGLKLLKKPGTGIMIEGPENKKLDLSTELSSSTKFMEPFSPEARKNYILRRLFMSNKNITIKELAEELYVSKVTIHKDLESVEEWLSKYNLKLIKKTNYGIEISGDEENWRNAAASLIVSNKGQDEIKELLYDDYTGRIDYKTLTRLKELIDIDYKKLEKIVSNMESRLEFMFSDEAFISLIIHIAISMERLRRNKDIRLSKDVLNKLKRHEEYTIAEKAAKEIEENFNIKLPDSEVGYILLHILGAKMQQNKLDDIDIEIKEDENIDIAVTMAKEIIKIAEKALSVDFSGDSQLLNGLILHLKPTINRLKYGLTLRNPILDQIKENYPDIFGVAWMTSTVFEKYIGKKAGEEELGYITLHLGAAFERAKKPLRALVVCSSGIGTSQLLAVRLERWFKNIEVVDIVSSLSLNDVMSDNVDFIISTVPVESNKPVINITPLLTQSDIKKLENFIDEYYESKKIVDVEIIDVDREFEEKIMLLKYVVSELIRTGYVKNEYLDDVLKREEVSSTYIGNGIAIPHGNPDNVNKSVISVIRLKKTISWGDGDVTLIIMVSINAADIKYASRFFRKLYNNIDDTNFRENLLKMKDKKEIEKLLMNNML